MCYRYTTGYQDLPFRFANFAAGAISKVYSLNGQGFVLPIAILEFTVCRIEEPSNSRQKSRLNEWRCSHIVVVPWPTRPVMERTTFLKNYRIRLQYDGTRYQPSSAGPATSYEAVDERT